MRNKKGQVPPKILAITIGVILLIVIVIVAIKPVSKLIANIFGLNEQYLGEQDEEGYLTGITEVGGQRYIETCDKIRRGIGECNAAKESSTDSFCYWKTSGRDKCLSCDLTATFCDDYDNRDTCHADPCDRETTMTECAWIERYSGRTTYYCCTAPKLGQAGNIQVDHCNSYTRKSLCEINPCGYNNPTNCEWKWTANKCVTKV